MSSDLLSSSSGSSWEWRGPGLRPGLDVYTNTAVPLGDKQCTLGGLGRNSSVEEASKQDMAWAQTQFCLLLARQPLAGRQAHHDDSVRLPVLRAGADHPTPQSSCPDIIMIFNPHLEMEIFDGQARFSTRG